MSRLIMENFLAITGDALRHDRMLQFAFKFARAHGAKLDVAHAVGADHSEVTTNAAEVAGALVGSGRYDLVIVSGGREVSTSPGSRITAERIVSEADCPVLIIGPQAGASYEPQAVPRAILYATDFSTAAAQAGRFAMNWAQEFQSRLTVLHVVEGFWALSQDERMQVEEPFRKWMSEPIPEELPLWCDLERRVEFGEAAETILRTAEQSKPDLIVIGYSGLEGVQSNLFGETAKGVIEYSSCPVLVVPEGAAVRELPKYEDAADAHANQLAVA